MVDAAEKKTALSANRDIDMNSKDDQTWTWLSL